MIKKISQYSKKPELYEDGTKLMWTDPHISEILLDTHLNDNIDLASRKGTTIDSTIEWILQKVPDGKLDILDLGCGPGLYTERLAKVGHRVRGVDFSERSVSHAKKSSEEKNLSVEYDCKDYLLIDGEEKYDLVIMIFTDFGVLVPSKRDLLLSKIHRILKPGGVFIFDFLNLNCLNRMRNESESLCKWEYSDSGFWKDSPHLVLNSSWIYAESNVSLSQHIVIDGDNNVELYRFWVHYFSDQELYGILTEKGFAGSEFFSNIIPESEFVKKNETAFCVSRKRN